MRTIIVDPEPMATRPHDAPAPKRATNLSVNEDLLRRARALGINLSRALEERLEVLVREQEQARWLEANRQAIEDYNRRMERDGAFGDEGRRF